MFYLSLDNQTSPDPFTRKNTFFSCFSVFISLYFTLFLSVLGLFQFLSVMAIPRNWRCSKTPVFSQYFQTWDTRFTSCYCSKPVLHSVYSGKGSSASPTVFLDSSQAKPALLKYCDSPIKAGLSY